MTSDQRSRQSAAWRRDGMGRSLHYASEQLLTTSRELAQMAELVRVGQDSEAASAALLIKWRLGEHLAYLDTLLAALHAERAPH